MAVRRALRAAVCGGTGARRGFCNRLAAGADQLSRCRRVWRVAHSRRLSLGITRYGRRLGRGCPLAEYDQQLASGRADRRLGRQQCGPAGDRSTGLPPGSPTKDHGRDRERKCAVIWPGAAARARARDTVGRITDGQLHARAATVARRHPGSAQDRRRLQRCGDLRWARRR